jgi:septal ring factor EnvC (AmiA/AmiB activator)
MRLLIAFILGFLMIGWITDHGHMQETIDTKSTVIAELSDDIDKAVTHSAAQHQSANEEIHSASKREADLANRLATEHTNCDVLTKANDNLKLDLKASQDAVADLNKRLGEATKRADDSKQRVVELEAEARRTKKEMLLLHDRCEPPDTVAATRQPQLEAPFDVGKNGNRRWLTDWGRAERHGATDETPQSSGDEHQKLHSLPETR